MHCLFVCLSVCPVCPVPSRPRKKVAKTGNFAKQSFQLSFKGVNKILSHAVVLGEAKPSYVYSNLKPHFRISSPPQSRSQAIVCISTPRMYPRSGYFLVNIWNSTSVYPFFPARVSVYPKIFGLRYKWVHSFPHNRHFYITILTFTSVHLSAVKENLKCIKIKNKTIGTSFT